MIGFYLMLCVAPDHPHMRFSKRLARQRARGGGGVKAWMRWWGFPPGVWEIVRRFVPRGHTDGVTPPEHAAPLSDLVFSRTSDPAWVSTENLRTLFGQAFTKQQHPFLRYLESGFDAFKDFYWQHQPTNVMEAHFFYNTLPGDAPKDMLAKPWEPPPPADSALPSRPNPEFLGPISRLALGAEVARLDMLRQSVAKKGFLPGHLLQLGGPISGQLFMHSDGAFRMMITNGNHRVAVLAHLGWKIISITPRSGFPHVRLVDLAQWPGVLDGRFTKEQARALFEGFFRPCNQQIGGRG